MNRLYGQFYCTLWWTWSPRDKDVSIRLAVGKMNALCYVYLFMRNPYKAIRFFSFDTQEWDHDGVGALWYIRLLWLIEPIMFAFLLWDMQNHMNSMGRRTMLNVHDLCWIVVIIMIIFANILLTRDLVKNHNGYM